ncbi:hypothetical protein IF2G_04414 [Cordyceps javanica]|nr:hypothetical protein IF2G_04414 [Cordyceps javanica]
MLPCSLVHCASLFRSSSVPLPSRPPLHRPSIACLAPVPPLASWPRTGIIPREWQTRNHEESKNVTCASAPLSHLLTDSRVLLTSRAIHAHATCTRTSMQTSQGYGTVRPARSTSHFPI